MKTLLRDHTGVKVSLAKIQSRSNGKWTTCITIKTERHGPVNEYSFLMN